MVTLHETDVDGVRCFWVESGRPTLAAQLVFRAGMADEPFTESGWFHLLEHLTLHPQPRDGTLQFNGSVSLLLTTFDGHGPAADVSKHLTVVAARLADPDVGHLDHERNILRAEASSRGAGPGDRALGWRFGARGPGVIGYAEPGLSSATPERLAERARSSFTRGNAVLVLDGPPPPDLSLAALPDGDRVAPPPAIPCKDRLPAGYSEGSLVMSGLVDRSPAATFIPDLVRLALRRRLRDEEAGAYAPWATYEPVDDDHAVVLAGSDLQPTLLPTIVKTALDLARGLTSDLQDDDVSQLVQVRLQSLRDPYAPVAVAVRAAHAVLTGRAPLTFEEMLQEVHDTDRSALAAGLRRFADTLLLGVPDDATFRGLPRLSFPLTTPTAPTRRFRSINWPADATTLAFDDEGFEIARGAEAQRVSFTDTVGLLQFDDGGRHAVRTDGYGLSVEPAYWRKGEDAVTHLDSVVTRALHVGAPARTEPPRPQTLSWPRRWWWGFRSHLGLVLWGLLTVLVVALGVAALVAGNLVIVGAAVIALLRLGWRRVEDRLER